jgi:hypothetical protein
MPTVTNRSHCTRHSFARHAHSISNNTPARTARRIPLREAILPSRVALCFSAPRHIHAYLQSRCLNSLGSDIDNPPAGVVVALCRPASSSRETVAHPSHNICSRPVRLWSIWCPDDPGRPSSIGTRRHLRLGGDANCCKLSRLRQGLGAPQSSISAANSSIC